MAATCWLTPVKSLEPLILGAERVPLTIDGVLESFRTMLSKRYNPWLLPLVKGAILATDSDDGGDGTDSVVCGSAEGPSFSEPGEIAFDGRLSECGQAFINRLPSSKEQAEAFAQALKDSDIQWSRQETEWLMQIRDWAANGLVVMLVKEE